jgi:DNA-binding GntR family transcriptional regulator
VTDEGLILMLAVAVETACRRMTPGHLAALSASVAQAASLPARSYWERKALAHAETISMLGQVTGDPALIRVAGHAAGLTYDLAVAAGPVADETVLNSRRRLLSHLRAGEAEAAGQEVEHHLRGLMRAQTVKLPGQRAEPGVDIIAPRLHQTVTASAGRSCALTAQG